MDYEVRIGLSSKQRGGPDSVYSAYIQPIPGVEEEIELGCPEDSQHTLASRVRENKLLYIGVGGGLTAYLLADSIGKITSGISQGNVGEVIGGIAEGFVTGAFGWDTIKAYKELGKKYKAIGTKLTERIRSGFAVTR